MALTTIERDEDALVAEPLIVMLRNARYEVSRKRYYISSYTATYVHLVFVEIPIFTYEPI